MTTPAVLMPDAEEVFIAYLGGKFPAARVVAELYLGFEDDVLDGTPVIRVSRIGGAQVRPLVLDGPRIDVDVYASCRLAASQVSREIAAHMFAAKNFIGGGGVVTSVAEEVGPSWRPEYNPQLYHFGATYLATLRPA